MWKETSRPLQRRGVSTNRCADYARPSGLLVGLSCGLALGCASESDSARPVGSAPQATEEHAGAAISNTTTGIPTDVVRLFSSMDAIGRGSQEAYDAELTAFLGSAQPLATLKRVYAQLPVGALAARWKAVHAAGQVRTAESVEFLEQVAASPAEVDSAATGHEAGDRSFRMRYTASVGVVHHYVNGVEGANTAVERLLKNADPQIAQMIGVELFSFNKLSDAWRQILSARGIFTKFRRLGEAELNALGSVDPAKSPRAGGDTRTRPRSVTVPALKDGE